MNKCDLDLNAIQEVVEDRLSRVAPLSGATIVHDGITGRATGLRLSAARTDICPGCGQTVRFQPEQVEGWFDDDDGALWVTATWSRQHGCGTTPPLATSSVSLDDLEEDADTAITAAIERLREGLTDLPALHWAVIGEDTVEIWSEDWDQLDTLPIPAGGDVYDVLAAVGADWSLPYAGLDGTLDDGRRYIPVLLVQP